MTNVCIFITGALHALDTICTTGNELCRTLLKLTPLESAA